MKKDFSEGKVWKIILSQAVPLMLAQLVQLLYNVVDRIYIGHMNGGDGTALTGIGLTFPIITFIVAFAALFGMGGVPLFSIANGEDRNDKAEKILGNSCCLLLISAAFLTVCGYIFCKPILYFLGASDNSYRFAAEYLRFYLAGTLFSMLNTGLNGYISTQGFPRIGMMTIVNVTSETGLFNFLAIWAAKKVKAEPVALLVALSVITAVWYGRHRQWCSSQHRSRPVFHFRLPPRSERRRHSNSYKSGSIGSLDTAFPYRQKCSAPAQAKEYPHFPTAYIFHNKARNFKLCNAGNDLLRTGCLQFNAAKLRR